MDAELKSKWVKALRSGEYEQCRNALHDGKGYCCLGVLAMVSGVGVDGRSETIIGYDPIYKLVGNDYIARELATRNDGYKCRANSFSEIADYIEANL